MGGGVGGAGGGAAGGVAGGVGDVGRDTGAIGAGVVGSDSSGGVDDLRSPDRIACKVKLALLNAVISRSAESVVSPSSPILG